MHVVQIWIMHINALKTQLMHKNAQTNPQKSQKFTQHSCCSMLTREKIWKQSEAIDIVLFPKVGRSLPKTIMIVVRSFSLWEAYTQTCRNWDKICTTACWCRSVRACIVSWIPDEFWIYKKLKTRHLNFLSAINGAPVFEIHVHFLYGP